MFTRRIRPPTIAEAGGKNEPRKNHMMRNIHTQGLEEIISVEKISIQTTKECKRGILEEIPLRVCAMYAPEVVDEDVEDTEGDDQEGG